MRGLGEASSRDDTARLWVPISSIAAVLLCVLSITALTVRESVYLPKWAPVASHSSRQSRQRGTVGEADEVRELVGEAERLSNGVNPDRSFGPLPIERAPNGSAWSNSLALCTMIKWEQPADVLEWVQYYKYALWCL